MVFFLTKCLICFLDRARRFRLRCWIDIHRNTEANKILASHFSEENSYFGEKKWYPAFSTRPRVFHTPGPRTPYPGTPAPYFPPSQSFGRLTVEPHLVPLIRLVPMTHPGNEVSVYSRTLLYIKVCEERRSLLMACVAGSLVGCWACSAKTSGKAARVPAWLLAASPFLCSASPLVRAHYFN